MANKPVKKRRPKFVDLNEVLADVELLRAGYVSNGNWTLGQSCEHIANWMRYPMDGFPVPPIFLRPIFWVMKITMAERMKSKIMAEGFSPGMPTAPESVPNQDQITDADGIASLKKVIDRANSFSGVLIPSPLFGPMDKETLIKVTLLHAEHHLGFLEPKT